MKFKYYGSSDIGKQRTENQDCFSITPLKDEALLAVICDGMGGVAGGKVAAELAISTFVSEFVRQFPEKFSDFSRISATSESDQAILSMLMTACAEAANNAVYRQGIETPSLMGMGTTLVAAFVAGDGAFIVNVGDSRLYSLEHNAMRQVTIDHSKVQMLLATGQITAQEAATYPHKNVITRAIGIASLVNAETFVLPLHTPQTLLLCSDGLHDILGNEEIYAIIWGSESIYAMPLEEKVARLIAAANQHGGRDNITAILISV